MQAALLAPSKQASNFAALEAVVYSHCITLGARRVDADGANEAIVEFVVADPNQAQCIGTACVGSISESIVIHGVNFNLFTSRARDGNGLHARCWKSSKNTSACWQIGLGKCCAI